MVRTRCNSTRPAPRKISKLLANVPPYTKTNAVFFPSLSLLAEVNHVGRNRHYEERGIKMSNLILTVLTEEPWSENICVLEKGKFWKECYVIEELRDKILEFDSSNFRIFLFFF